MSSPFRLLCGALVAILVTGCTATTGNRIALNQQKLSAVKTLAIAVKTNESFGVYFDRDRLSNTGTAVGAVAGGAIGALVGASLEAGARMAADSVRTEKLRPQARDVDPTKLLAERLREQCLNRKLFSSVEVVPPGSAASLKSKNVDGYLVLTVDRWGMSPCPDANLVGERLQVGVALTARLSSVGKDEVLWERNDFFLDGICQPMSAYLANTNMLSQQIDAALADLAARLANEIQFPR